MPLTRRDLFQLLPAAAAPLAFPRCLSRSRAGPVFFSDEEHRALGALCDHVLPPDHEPGGAALGAVDYIEGWLTALEVEPPLVHAGGPFSGRTPFADMRGRASDRRPRNELARFVPPGRLALAAARLGLYGSRVEVLPNEPLTGPVEGLRDLVRRGLREAMAAAAPARLEALDLTARARVWSGLPADFRGAIVELTLEAALAPPEYGGNRGLAGWRMIHFEGDSQPLGFSLFDETAGVYRERAGFPVSVRDAGPDVDPMDAETLGWVEVVTAALGGRKFR